MTLEALAPEAQQEQDFTPCITFPNELGDVTITWDESNAEFVKQMVQEKMDKNYSFFILKPRTLMGKPIPAMGTRKVKVKKIEDLENVNSVTLRTEDPSEAMDFIKKDKKVQNVNMTQKGLDVAIDVRDKDLNLGIEKGKLKIDKKAVGAAVSTRRAKTADEVLKNQSLGVRPLAGG